MPQCGKCGKEFDSERGLKVHNAQVHDDNPEVVETKKKTSVGNVTFRLNIRHALVLAFAVGIVTGGFVSLMALQMGGATGFLTFDGNSDNGGQPSAPADDSGSDSPAKDTIDPSQISMENEPILGDENAPVTMVLYEDYQCPFCQRFEQGAMQQIVNEYVKSGDVRIVWKDYPLPQIGHGWAVPAAEAMECVYRQDEDAFWTVKDKVFQNQNSYPKNNADPVVQDILDWAADEGVSKSAVQSCMENDNPRDAVKEDMQEGRNVDVSGTPTIFINGKKIVGAQPFSAFQQVIESELQG